MPRYYEDKPEGGPCSGVKEDLGVCLLQSDCVLQSEELGFSPDFQHQKTTEVNVHRKKVHKEGKSPRQCLKEGYCKALQYSFFECKRSMLDTRSRFRGRKGY
ncbi:cytochrome c oxidase assembly factor 5 isoform X1 [Nycticebus coucang]|uniref:cytochrome c oxidase assembly factor 5 isoform X1 n=1 Tax=Nycticebus coucang TaxID=9470 RepID=UPI00234DC8C5|nr:cytochrome c oxidase assembly factor 5 isoform X1 [Nycticebus coucang]